MHRHDDARAASDDDAPESAGPPADGSGEPASRTTGKSQDTFSIVGIGASAGGLAAYAEFFKALPENPGMAFVLVQHLAPNHESELAELLQNHTPMRVVQVQDQMRAESDSVYVIPPGKALAIQDGVLLLHEPDQPHGRRAPIDDFFRSLASDQGESAVCIVLSGTGSDGSIGLKTLKEAGGLTLAQSPDDAEYDGMPRNAVNTGFVDVVLPAAELAARLVSLRHTGIPIPEDTSALPENDSEALSRIFIQLRAGTGHDFSRYKTSTVLRRIGRRMQVLGVDDLSSYLRALRKNENEVQALLKDLLISVTSFFRDAAVFDTVEREIIPKLFAGKTADDQVRVWVPGCATGEEAYSLAILLCEYASTLAEPPALQIFATDIDEQALTFAREGHYPEVIAADVGPDWLEKYFEHDSGAYRVKKSVRETVLFASHNLLKDPPFSKLDLVSCRNLLIYLQRETQERVFELFAYALRPPGFLLLGTSESVETTNDLFATINKKHRIFRGRSVARHGLRIPLIQPLSSRITRSVEEEAPSLPASFEELHHRVLVAHHTPPSVIVGPGYEVLHSAGDVARFLSFATGEPTNNVLRLVPSVFRPELRTALFQAFENGRPSERQVRAMIDGEPTGVLLNVRPLRGPEAEGFVQIAFTERPPTPSTPPKPHDSDDRGAIEHLEYELQRTQERLQTSVEEYETSNEELKASNEELLSMNEELQSTTEELETGREELQSINEELTTVNQELKTKIEELHRSNADLHNLINSTDVATLFLDRDLRIKRFTPRLAELFNIIASDRGRPIEHLTQRMSYEAFIDDARDVLTTLVPVEREIEDNEGQCFLTRIVPYRTSDDRIDGVVATFVDITRRTQAEEAAASREEHFRRVILESPFPVFFHAEDGALLQVSRSVTKITGYSLDELSALNAWTGLAYGDRSAEILAGVERLHDLDEQADEGEFEVVTKAGEKRIWHFFTASVGTDAEGRRLAVSMAADVTARKRAENEREARSRQQHVVASLGLYALSGADIQALFERAVHFVQVTLGADLAKVLELEPDGHALRLRAGTGWTTGSIGKATVPNTDRSQAGYTLTQEVPVVVEDYAQEERFVAPALLVDHDVTSGASIVIGNAERPFGVLGAHSRTPRSYSPSDLDFLQAVANVLTSAIERAEAYRQTQDAHKQLEAYAEDLERRVEARTESLRVSEARLRTLYDVISQPTASIDNQIGEALAKATDLLGFDVGMLGRVEGDDYELVACHAPGTDLAPGQAFALDTTCIALTIAEGGTVAIPDLSAPAHCDLSCADAPDAQSYLGVPVQVDDNVFGALSFSGNAPRPDAFREADLDFAELLARWIGVTLARHHADADLEQSERLLTGVLLGSLDGIAVLEADRGDEGQIVDFCFRVVNPAAADVYGRSAEELAGTHYLDRVPGTREIGVFDAIVRVAETGEPYRHEVLYQADDIDGWYDFTIVKLGDGVALTFRDVTERKEAEHALRASEARFRELFESSPDAIFVETPDGVVLDVNPAACRLHRTDRDWLIGRSIGDLVPPDHRTQALEDFSHFVSGASGLIESYSLAKDGTAVPVEVRTDQITFGGQEAVLLHVRDISARRRSEQALRESEDRFAKAFQAAPVAVTISTYPEGRYIDVNDSFCLLTGYARDEIIGQTNEELGLLRPGFGDVPFANQLRALGQVREVEFQIIRRDGVPRDVLVSAERLDLAGEPCILGIGFDVTDRKHLEREVIEATELERRRIGQDLHDELGQQLTGAAFLGESLRQRLAAQGSADAEAAGQLTALINDVLAETRDLAQLLSPVDVQAEGLADALQSLADQTERVFDTSCPLVTEGDVGVRDNAAATHLFRIAQEAVNNAIKHAEPSEITIRLAKNGSGLHLSITDNGDGFDPGLLQSSLGLGLRTMRYRAALIGASIAVEPGDQGTRVVVRLPSA